MLKITSAATATSRGVSHHCSPRPISGSAFDLVRSFPYNSCPASSRRPETRLPIAPNPTNPIVLILFTCGCLFSISASACRRRALGGQARSGGDVGELVRMRTGPADLAFVERGDPRDVV